MRYADDCVILCRPAEEAPRAWDVVQPWTAAHGLTLLPDQTRIVDVRPEGLDFLGYRFQRTQRGIHHGPRPRSLARLQDNRRTRRTDGRRLPCSIADVRRVLRGWFGYFQHRYSTPLAPLDGGGRQCLRSVLRRRTGGRGRGRGADQQRWPTAFCAEQGRYSLVAA